MWIRKEKRAAPQTGRAHLILLGAILVLVIITATGMGYMRISAGDVIRIIFSGVSGNHGLIAGINKVFPYVVWDIRLPRVLTAAGGGAGLSLAGVVFQGILLNPLADPYTPVVLLDEATSNMDIRHTLDILDIVAGDVETGGKTVIAALHNLNLAATYCDKLVFMKSGRVVSRGDRDQVLTEETLYEVFGIESRVYFDEYVGSRQVAFRRRRP